MKPDYGSYCGEGGTGIAPTAWMKLRILVLIFGHKVTEVLSTNLHKGRSERC